MGVRVQVPPGAQITAGSGESAFLLRATFEQPT